MSYGQTGNLAPSSEKILLDRSREGDERSFQALVSAHAARSIGLAHRLVGNRDDAEDIAQEAFLRLHRSLESFRGDAAVGTWLYRTITRLAIDHLRREKIRRAVFFFRRTTEEPDPVETAPDPGAGQSRQLLAKEISGRLNEALSRLSARQRAVFILRHQEGIPLKEIGRILNLEEGTVKAHLHRAVTALRRELKDLQKD